MSITIEIDNPEEMLILLDGLTANSHAQFEIKSDLIKKIHRAILLRKHQFEWRLIVDFPDFEISGGGLIRHRRSHVSLVVWVMPDEPTTVNLDDEHGWEHTVLYHEIYNKAFPELKA